MFQQILGGGWSPLSHFIGISDNNIVTEPEDLVIQRPYANMPKPSAKKGKDPTPPARGTRGSQQETSSKNKKNGSGTNNGDGGSRRSSRASINAHGKGAPKVTPAKGTGDTITGNRMRDDNDSTEKVSGPGGKKSKKRKAKAFGDGDDVLEDVDNGKRGGAVKSTSIRGISEVSEEDDSQVKMLKSIIRMQQEKVEEARRIENMGHQLRSREKVRYHTKRNIGKRDPMGQQMVNRWVEGCFTVTKFLPPNFQKYSTRRNTPCGMIMSSIKGRLDAGQGYYQNLSEQEYWHGYICPALMYRWGQRTNQRLQKMRKSVMGEKSALFVLSSILTVRRTPHRLVMTVLTPLFHIRIVDIHPQKI